MADTPPINKRLMHHVLQYLLPHPPGIEGVPEERKASVTEEWNRAANTVAEHFNLYPHCPQTILGAYKIITRMINHDLYRVQQTLAEDESIGMMRAYTRSHKYRDALEKHDRMVAGVELIRNPAHPYRQWVEGVLVTDFTIEDEDRPAYVRDLLAWHALKEKPAMKTLLGKAADINKLTPAILKQHRAALQADPGEMDRCARLYRADFGDSVAILAENAEHGWQLRHLKNRDAAYEHGRGSSLCTYTDDAFESYENDLWMFVSGSARVQIHIGTGQMMDRLDQNVTYSQLEDLFPGGGRAVIEGCQKVCLNLIRDVDVVTSRLDNLHTLGFGTDAAFYPMLSAVWDGRDKFSASGFSIIGEAIFGDSAFAAFATQKFKNYLETKEWYSAETVLNGFETWLPKNSQDEWIGTVQKTFAELDIPDRTLMLGILAASDGEFTQLPIFQSMADQAGLNWEQMQEAAFSPTALRYS